MGLAIRSPPRWLNATLADSNARWRRAGMRFLSAMIALPAFLESFDRTTLQARAAEAETRRRELLALFPPEDIGSLPLERYAIGTDENSLCRLLEFSSDALGSIRGGSSFKYAVYRSKNGEWISKLPGEPDPRKAWDKLRADLASAVDLCRAGEFQKLDALPAARYMPAARTKLMHIYFPGEVLPVFSLAHLRHFLENLGGNFEKRPGQRSTASANHELLLRLRSMPELAGWSTTEMGIMLYKWGQPPGPRQHVPSPPEDGPRLMKIPPGEKGRLWDKCLRGSCIAVGWNEMGDLWQYPDLESFTARFQDAYPKPTGQGRASNEAMAQRLWQLRELEIGDLIAANKGTSTILAVGKVIGPVRYEPDGFEYHTVVPVEWDTGYQRVIPPQKKWAFSTIEWLAPELRDLILDRNKQPELKPPPVAAPLPVNRILYGPPGTGKTYSVIRDAVKLCDGSFDEASVRQRFDELRAAGRIRFVTFHQSYAYEDFIEGIRPVLEEGGRAGFEMRAGVFKQLAAEAGFSCLEPIEPIGDPKPFEAYWNALLRELDEAEVVKIPGLSDQVFELRKNTSGNLEVLNTESGAKYGCTRNVLGVVWAAYARDFTRITSSQAGAAYKKGAHHNVNAAVFNYLQTKQLNFEPAKAEPLPLPASAPERASIFQDFLDRGEASGWRLRPQAARPGYVLVIDEINRGNISRVFGELITLIEDDKRLGAENALTLTLPVSGELFTVPPNLHLLGTMNTADKSLALLDVALRRRFEFHELAPDFSLCPELPPEMAEVLERINDRLERRKDRDHRIGHAFFMRVEDRESFNAVFLRKVVPLLQEYFFTDPKGARYVLGEEKSEDAQGFLRPLAQDGDSKWARQRWRWFMDDAGEDGAFDCWGRLALTLGDNS